MKKRIFLTLAVTVIVMMLFAVGVSAATVISGSCGDNLIFTLDSDGVLTVSLNSDVADDSVIVNDNGTVIDGILYTDKADALLCSISSVV